MVNMTLYCCQKYLSLVEKKASFYNFEISRN